MAGILEVTKVLESEVVNLLRSIDRNLAVIADAADDDRPPSINLNLSYTRTQAARLLSVSTWTIDRARKSGHLVEAQRIGKRDVRITGASLMQFHQQSQRVVRVQRV